MLALPRHHDRTEFSDRLRDAHAATVELLSTIIDQTRRRLLSVGQAGKSARIERLVEAGAWTDAALALIDLELPQWQVRRIAYDGGEWYCALSRERELPNWLDEPVEAHHADLALAILSAFVEAQHFTATAPRPSVPCVSYSAGALYEPVSCDNFA